LPIKHLTLALAMLAPVVLPARQVVPFLGKTIVLEDSLGAARANLRSDAYTASQTSFDRSIRLQRTENLGEKAYLELAAVNMRNWSSAEESHIQDGLAAMEAAAKAMQLKLPMPDTVFICKTAGEEEFGAEGYTRDNRIMLHASLEELTPALLSHELWHVLSRLAPATRDRAYSGFGFKPCNRVDYKPAFNGQVISNPDCPFIEHYIHVTKDGTGYDLAILLYSRSPFVKGGGLMDYVAVGLLALEGDDSHKKVVMQDGRPKVYPFSAFPAFFDQVGRNTDYMLHIEELTAEHFAALMTARKMKEPRFVDKLASALR
jgi:hypothetical protein